MSRDDPSSVELRVNGDVRTFHEVDSVAALVAALGCDPRTVAVELTGRIVRREQFPEQALGDGDRVEVVRFVQGG